MQGGTVSRPQPILLFSTTAGEDRDSWCYSQHEIFERILRGSMEDFDFSDSWFVFIASMSKDDSPEDETKWIKSNPSLGVTLTVESLRIEAASLKADPASRFSFLRFHANVWQSVVAGHSLPQDAINKCIGVELPEGGAKALRETVLKKFQDDRTVNFGGFDLGLSDDLAAFVLVSPNFVTGITKTGDYAKKTSIIPWVWMPANRLREKETLWRVPLQQWVREGWLKIAGEDLVDIAIIEEDIKQICATYRCPVIGYDKWKSEILFARLHEQRVAHCVSVAQLPSLLTTPSRYLKSGILNGTIAHLNNPILKWQLSNVDLEPDEKHGGIKPAKSGGDRRLKIDLIQATCTSLQQMLDPENKKWFTNPRVFFV
jgi:phage terminase large subunit-like protein